MEGVGEGEVGVSKEEGAVLGRDFGEQEAGNNN